MKLSAFNSGKILNSCLFTSSWFMHTVGKFQHNKHKASLKTDK
jgi:hypothetical protein